MSVQEKAARLHGAGFNCAQCVLSACGEYTGLDNDKALALTGGLGGGVRCGEICGALTGAVLAIGLANPYTDGTDADARTKIAKLTKECTSAFKDEFGCLRCVDLKKSGHSCDTLIAFSAGLAENIINENK